MNTDLVRSLISLVKAEEQNRKTARLSMSPEAANWSETFEDTPLVNELYLLVLLFMWHGVEREILLIAAQSSVSDTSPMSRDAFSEKVHSLGNIKRRTDLKAELAKLLPSLDGEDWKLLEVLRFLANSYKHEPFSKPKRELLKLLHLTENMNCASLSESGALRFGLNKFLGINEEDGTFSEIADTFCNRCNGLLLRLQCGKRPFDRKRVSLNPDTFEH